MDIEIADIAHGLAFVARWNGQTLGDWPYSVAEHSLLVERIFSQLNPGIGAKWQMAALLHDAPEYVIGDMISPVKAAIGPGYGVLDERLTVACGGGAVRILELQRAGKQPMTANEFLRGVTVPTGAVLT